ncbi:MAG TPA: hypothetical protein VIJ14_09355, partial [Rhabdochlamydiaceae bacterium]
MSDIIYDDQIASGFPYNVGESILVVPFWKEEFCKKVIEAAEWHGGFAPLPEDAKTGNAPGQELRISQFSPWLLSRYKEHWLNYLKGPICSFYRYSYMFDRGLDCFRDPFLVKYSMDGQKNMKEHHDSSLLSIMIKLNSDFEGTDLIFPRQGWSNYDVPVGWGVIFPGQC